MDRALIFGEKPSKIPRVASFAPLSHGARADVITTDNSDPPAASEQRERIDNGDHTFSPSIRRGRALRPL
jgi:hypothetical protein